MINLNIILRNMRSSSKRLLLFGCGRFFSPECSATRPVCLVLLHFIKCKLWWKILFMKILITPVSPDPLIPFRYSPRQARQSSPRLTEPLLNKPKPNRCSILEMESLNPTYPLEFMCGGDTEMRRFSVTPQSRKLLQLSVPHNLLFSFSLFR